MGLNLDPGPKFQIQPIVRGIKLYIVFTLNVKFYVN